MTTTDLLSRLQKLSPQRRQLLARQIAEQAAARTNSSNAGGQQNLQLVAYIIKDAPTEVDSLRSNLKGQLPDYMVPSHFVELDQFPRLPNGKIDRNALPPPGKRSSSSEKQYTAARTEIEKQLVTIWEDVLNVRPIGIHDNFFEIGGDSILSIQIIAKARKVGIQLAPNQLFDLQSIAELALFTQSNVQEKETTQITSGPVPLTPIQHWFFEEHKLAPQHWNQVFQFDLQVDLTSDLLKTAIFHLYQRHEALRLSFVKSNDIWQAEIMPPSENTMLQSIELGQHPLAEQESYILAKVNEIQSNFKLENGGLFQALYIDCGQVQPNKLVLIAHHLIIDNVSWQLLAEELQTSCSQLLEGETTILLPPNSSYGEWAKQLASMAEAEWINEDLDFWQTQGKGIEIFPTDLPQKLPQTESKIQTHILELASETTVQVTETANQAYHTRTDELLLAALIKTLNEWSGLAEITLSLERHGREVADKDLTGIVGWFTSYFPLSFQIEAGSNEGTIIKEVKETLRKIPNGGLSYGILRYLNSEHSQKLQQQPAIIFNFLGQQIEQASSFLSNLQPIFDGARASESERYQLLEINAFIREGRLIMRWDYSRELYQSETIETLISHYRSSLDRLIEHCLSMEHSEHTPTDFPDADLSQSDLDRLMDLF